MTVSNINPESGASIGKATSIQFENSVGSPVDTVVLRREGFDDETIFAVSSYTTGYSGEYSLISSVETFSFSRNIGWLETPIQIIVTLDDTTEVTITYDVLGISVFPAFFRQYYNGGGSSSTGFFKYLNDLLDVTTTGVTNGQAIVYDSATKKWVPGAGGGGASALDDLTDVNAAAPNDLEVLGWDAVAGEWSPRAPSTPGAHTLNSHSDVTVPTPVNGDFLSYDSGSLSWVNTPNVVTRTGLVASNEIVRWNVSGSSVVKAATGITITDAGIINGMSEISGSALGALDIQGGYTAGTGTDLNLDGGQGGTGNGDVNIATVHTGGLNIGATGVPITITDSAGSTGSNTQVLTSDGNYATWEDSGVNQTLDEILTQAPIDNDVALSSGNPLFFRDGGAASMTPLNLERTGTGTNTVIAASSLNGRGMLTGVYAGVEFVTLNTNALIFNATATATLGFGATGGSAGNDLILYGGQNKTTTGTAGDLFIYAGTGSGGAAHGEINIGTASSTGVTIGRQTATLTITDSAGSTGGTGQVLTASGTGDSTWENSAGGGSATPRERGVCVLDTNISADTTIVPGTNATGSLLDYSAATFQTDVEIYINGRLQRSGATSGSNFDVYPAGTATNGDFACEYDLQAGDVIQMFIGGGPSGGTVTHEIQHGAYVNADETNWVSWHPSYGPYTDSWTTSKAAATGDPVPSSEYQAIGIDVSTNGTVTQVRASNAYSAQGDDIEVELWRIPMSNPTSSDPTAVLVASGTIAVVANQRSWTDLTISSASVSANDTLYLYVRKTEGTGASNYRMSFIIRIEE